MEYIRGSKTVAHPSPGGKDPLAHRPEQVPSLQSPTVFFEPTTFEARKYLTETPETPLESDSGKSAGDKPFGEYDLLREIARGGMGVVYKARDRKLQRVVALKMILSGRFASSEDVLRFGAEAHAAAILDHPGIVPIYEVGECEGRHYYAMGFVDGTSLAARLADGPLEPTEAAGLIQKIAVAVHYAHQHGVVHRDLKPANVLLDDQGQPRITDFGLAKQLAHDSHLTTSGQILGTPSYMPPEQAAGAIDRIGPHSDVYSIGAILYALLTGRPPFHAASTLDTLRQVQEREPVAPKALNPKVPTDLNTICLKCLQKDPGRRYASAQDLAADVGRFLRGEPVIARPASALDRAWKWARRRPALAALWGLVVVLAISGVGGISWQWWRAELSARKSLDLAKVAQDQRDDAQAARDETKQELRRSLMLQSRAGRYSGRPGRRFQGLAAVQRAVEIRSDVDLREEAIACLALADARVERAIKFARPVPPGVIAAFDANVERYAVYDAQGAISLHDARIDRRLATFPGPGIPISWLLRFSPDGRYLAAKHEGSGRAVFHIWNVDSETPIYETSDAVSFAAVDFHPAGEQAALVDTSGRLRVIELKSGREVREFSLQMQPYTISYHPSGEKLAVSNHTQPNVLIVDAATGKVESQLPHAAGVRGLAWGPRGRELATASGLHVCLWDVARQRQIAKFEGHGNTVTHAFFNRGGNLLASYGWDNETRFWDPRCGKQLFSVPGEIIQFGRFSPDDARVGFKASEREIGIWQVAAGQELRTLGFASSHAPYQVSASFSHDDRLLVTASHDGLKLWDTVEFREVFFVPCSQLTAASFAPRDDGLLLSDLRGISRWPLERKEQPGATHWQLRATPPEISLPSPASCAQSRDGKIVAVAGVNQVEVFSVDSAGHLERLFVGPHASAAYVSVSPEGAWVASGTWKGTGVKVWNVADESLARELPVEGNAIVGFSPDGKLLGTSTGLEYRLWTVGDWVPSEPLERDQGGDVPGAVCFSPDGKLWAVLAGRTGTLRLVSSSDGRVLAELESGPQLPLCFSRDGGRLAVVGDKGRVSIWDLSLLRDQLGRLGLTTSFTPSQATTDSPESSPELPNSAAKPLIVELAPATPR